MEEEILDEHGLLDLSAKMEIILQGMRYAVFFRDLDALNGCMLELKHTVDVMDEVVEEQFGKN